MTYLRFLFGDSTGAQRGPMSGSGMYSGTQRKPSRHGRKTGSSRAFEGTRDHRSAPGRRSRNRMHSSRDRNFPRSSAASFSRAPRQDHRRIHPAPAHGESSLSPGQYHPPRQGRRCGVRHSRPAPFQQDCPAGIGDGSPRLAGTGELLTRKLGIFPHGKPAALNAISLTPQGGK